MFEQQIRRRLDEFDGPIGNLAHDNPAIYRIIQEYAYGRIVTKEEALSQMVVILAQNWNEITRKQFDLAMRFPEMFTPQKPPTT